MLITDGLRRRPFSMCAALTLTVALVLGACTTGRDQATLDAAHSLVPDGSEVTEVLENTGPEPIVGAYRATLRITDGGLGDGLLDAIEERAASGGWKERYRCEVHDGITLGYSSADHKVDVGVHTNDDPVYASIGVMRLDEGNPWPPEC